MQRFQSHTLSGNRKRRKQRLCKPVQVLSLYINVSPAWYNFIYVLYVSDQTVQQQKQQQQGDLVSVKALIDGGLLAKALFVLLVNFSLSMEHIGELRQRSFIRPFISLNR